MQAEQRVIKKIASRASTEELLFFIAEDDAITAACSALQKKIAGNNKKELKEIQACCQIHHISLAHLARELQHIQSIFSPPEDISDDHKLLGLQAGASIAEVKQAFRRLSLQYHPDTSGQSNTTQFIEITKAYQRILNSADTKNQSPNNPSPSSSAWRYRKKNPPQQQRKKKYLYFFSLVSAAIVLVIVIISIHYQKRAMLHNISTKKTASPQGTGPAEATRPAGTIQPADKASSPENADVQQKVQRKEIETQSPAGAAIKRTEGPSPPPIFQGDVPVPALPVRPASINQVQSLIPEVKNEVHGERFTSPLSLANAPFDTMEKKQVSAQEPERVTDMSVTDKSVPTKKEDNEPFADILSQESSFKTTQKELPAGAHQPPRQKETSSLFSKAPYQKVPVVKANLKKIRKNSKKKGAEAGAQKDDPSMSVLGSLREFVQSYTAAYMSRDIKRFSLFFTDSALENGRPFAMMRIKYKQLFKATQSIDYTIDLQGTDIQEEGARATLTGRFHVQLTYNPGRIRSNSGTLTFFLVKEDRSYKIKALSYNLDPKW